MGYREQAERAAALMAEWPVPGKAKDCTCPVEQPLAYAGSYICAAGCPIHDLHSEYLR